MNGKIDREVKLLRNRRVELGMSQMDVAMNTDILLQEYQRFEYGSRMLSNSSMTLGLRVCAVLDLDPYEFVFENSTNWTKKHDEQFMHNKFSYID